MKGHAARGDSSPLPRLPRVIHLTTVHSAEDTRIFHRECTTLAAAGYDVVLIAPRSGDAMQRGVTIRSVPVPIGRRDRMLRIVPQVFWAALRKKAGIYHFHDPELLPVAILLKLLGKKVVADVHEEVPQDILTKYWLPARLRKPLAWMADKMETLASVSVDAVIAATPVIARRFPAHKTVVVRNYPISEEWASVVTARYSERPPLVAYVGKIAAIRSAREMVEAVRLVDDIPGIELALAGDYAPAELESDLRAVPGWERVHNMGFLKRPQVGELLGRARIGLVLLHPGPNHIEAQPNKLFEYMAAGLPVIASDFPIWRELFEELDCGLVVNPLDPGEIAQAMSMLLRDRERAEAMGRRGREAVVEKYNWGREARGLLDLYERLREDTSQP